MTSRYWTNKISNHITIQWYFVSTVSSNWFSHVWKQISFALLTCELHLIIMTQLFSVAKQTISTHQTEENFLKSHTHTRTHTHPASQRDIKKLEICLLFLTNYMCLLSVSIQLLSRSSSNPSVLETIKTDSTDLVWEGEEEGWLVNHNKLWAHLPCVWKTSQAVSSLL